MISLWMPLLNLCEIVLDSQHYKVRARFAPLRATDLKKMFRKDDVNVIP